MFISEENIFMNLYAAKTLASVPTREEQKQPTKAQEEGRKDLTSR